jgi:DNA-binding NarL/FixJ family response regulator
MLTLKEIAELYLAEVPDAAPDIAVTDRERQLLLMEAAGCTASEIADTLGTTEKSVQECQKDLARRLDIVNKSGSRVAKALQYGLIAPKDIRFLKR